MNCFWRRYDRADCRNRKSNPMGRLDGEFSDVGMVRSRNRFSSWRIDTRSISDKETCRFFAGRGTDRHVYDLKRHGSLGESKGGLSFHVKTRAPNGVILSAQGSQGDFVLIQLKNGRLEVVIDFGKASWIVGEWIWYLDVF